MRRVLFFTLLGVLVATVATARKPRDKAGQVKDGVYTDKKYNFRLTPSDGWKCKVSDNDDNFRLTLTQVNYEIPPNYLDAPDYTKIPRMVVFIDTSTMGASPFMDSLLSNSYKSKQKKEIFKEFEILNGSSAGSGMTREDVIPTGRKSMDIAGERAVVWTGKAKYRNEISTSASSMGAKRVYGGFGGCIVAAKKGEYIVLIHTICEENYFQTIMAEATNLAGSLEWVE